MAEFEVASKLKRLCHGDIAPCLEQHHRNRAAREGVSNNQLCDDVQPNLLVRYGLDHANGNNVYGC